MVKSGASVLSVGNCINLSLAKQKAPSMVFQGNVNNQILADGTKQEITKAVKQCFLESEKQNHILNLNHGLLERTPFENIIHFIKVAKKYGMI